MNKEMREAARREYWSLEYRTHCSEADRRLMELVLDYDFEYFSDMRFEMGSVVEDYIKCEFEDDDGEVYTSSVDFQLSLESSGYRFYVKELEDGVFGSEDPETGMVYIAPEFAEDKATILHEMIHVREDMINEGFMYYHDILTLCLYNDLKKKIEDLDDRIIQHTHVILGDRITLDGGSHDILFFLKSLDLDLRCRYKLGTVCGYGRDGFGESGEVGDEISATN